MTWIDALLIPARARRFFDHAIRRRDVGIVREAPAPEKAPTRLAIVASTTPISSSVGGGAGWKRLARRPAP